MSHHTNYSPDSGFSVSPDATAGPSNYRNCSPFSSMHQRSSDYSPVRKRHRNDVDEPLRPEGVARMERLMKQHRRMLDGDFVPVELRNAKREEEEESNTPPLHRNSKFVSLRGRGRGRGGNSNSFQARGENSFQTRGSWRGRGSGFKRSRNSYMSREEKWEKLERNFQREQKNRKTYQAERNDYFLRCETLEKENEDLKEDLNGKDAEIEKYRSEIEKMRKEVESATKLEHVVIESGKHLDHLLAENRQLHEVSGQSLSQACLLQNWNEMLKAENEMLKSKSSVGIICEELNEYKNKFFAASSRIEEVEAELKKIDDQLLVAKAELEKLREVFKCSP